MLRRNFQQNILGIYEILHVLKKEDQVDIRLTFGLEKKLKWTF
jgi:hypothetical protein